MASLSYDEFSWKDLTGRLQHDWETGELADLRELLVSGDFHSVVFPCAWSRKTRPVLHIWDPTEGTTFADGRRWIIKKVWELLKGESEPMPTTEVDSSGSTAIANSRGSTAKSYIPRALTTVYTIQIAGARENAGSGAPTNLHINTDLDDSSTYCILLLADELAHRTSIEDT